MFYKTFYGAAEFSTEELPLQENTYRYVQAVPNVLKQIQECDMAIQVYMGTDLPATTSMSTSASTRYFSEASLIKDWRARNTVDGLMARHNHLNTPVS